MANEACFVIAISAVLLVLLGVGSALLIVGITKKRTVLASLGGVLVAIDLFLLLDYFPQYAGTFSTWATLLLAFGAFIAVAVTVSLEERRVRVSNRVREEQIERDFKGRCLSDIEHWAKEGASLFVKLALPVRKPSDLSERLAPLRAVNNWVMNASREFDEPKLPRLVDTAAENLKQCTDWLEGDRSIENPVDLFEQCRHSLVKVLECIANLKVELRL